MDSETNPMVITAMIGLQGPPSAADLNDLVDRLAALPRFRQRIAPAPPARWEPDPLFDPTLHVHRFALASPGGAHGLAGLVGDLMSAPLDRSRPLWQLYLVEGVEPPIGRGAAFIVRVHHSLGDGAALVRSLLALSGAAAPPAQVGLPPQGAPRLAERAVRVARATSTLARLVRLPSDRGSLLDRKPSRAKRVGWSRTFALAEVKAAARSLEAKTNDVILASVSGALRSYLARNGALLPGLEVRALVPILLRGTLLRAGLANHFGLAFVALPLACASPLERLREVKRTMAAIKSSPEAFVTFAVLGAAGRAGAFAEKLAVDFFTRKASVLVTNVAGPSAPLDLAGRRVESVTAWAPTAGHLGVGMTLVSMAGDLRMAVASDSALVPDPASLAAAFEEDLSALITASTPS
jgi:hypothetical protein